MAQTVRSIRLGSLLRGFRTGAGETREELAVVLGCSPSKVTYVETGRNVISKSDLKVWLEHYGREADLDCLEGLRKEASKRGWWSTYRLPEWLASYIGLEDEAETLRMLAIELIPGLFQTEQYARELHQLAPHLTPPDEVERRVKARIQRQSRLIGGLKVTALISEAALRRCLGTPIVARGQMEKLLTTARLPNVDMRVLPFDAGLHSSMQGSFSLLTFPEGLLPPVAYQEYAVGGHIIDESAIVSSLVTIYRGLLDQAIGASESLVVIEELTEHTR